MFALSSVSNREKTIWADLVLDGIVAVYFFPRIWFLEGEIGDHSKELAGLVGAVIVISVFWSILIPWLLDVGEVETKDERDHLIEAKSALAGYYVLSIAISFLMGHIILKQVSSEIFNFQYEALSALKIVTYMFLGLVGSTFIKDIVKLFHYRRGY